MRDVEIDPRPGAPAFVDRCRGRDPKRWVPGAASTDPVRAELARRWLVAKVLRRRRWALHRHVHLRAAFEDAASRAPVRSVLSAGCGSATSELLLAVDHPSVTFTLTDHDPAQLAAARRLAEAFGLRNVRIEQLDLLGDDVGRGGRGAVGRDHDLVVSIEVLEHIDDDRRALAAMVRRSRRFVWVLVPYCDAAQLADERARRVAIERHGHVRPGYPHELLAERFAGLDTLWRRNCYFHPDAEALRARLAASGRARLVRDEGPLFAAAVRDIRGQRVVSGRDAAGIEILAQVRT